MTGRSQRDVSRSAAGGVSRSAAEWFAVMRGPEADAERGAFEEWLAMPVNAEAYAGLEATWDDSLFLANSRTGRDRDLARARRRMPPAALLAAGIALLTLLSAGLVAGQMGWLGPAATGRSAATRIAAADGVRTVRLSDGSRATLDRGAAISDLSTARERRFVLLGGRARFDVVHEPGRPFIVDAGAGSIVAHGTVFDVAIEGDAVRVVLVRGSVEVLGGKTAASGRRASRFLAPGDELTMRGGMVGAPSRTDGSRLAWAEPMIDFDEVPLAEAIAAFNRGGGRQVRIEGDRAGSRRVSGAFRRDDPQGFADALGASFDMEVAPAPDGSLMLRASAPDAR